MVALVAEGRFPVKSISETLQISRSNLSDRKEENLELLPRIRSLVDARPNYGYRQDPLSPGPNADQEGKSP